MDTAAERALRKKAERLLYDGRFLPAKTRAAEACEIYEQFARDGDTYAQLLVGWMHYTGHGIPKNETLGLEWYSNAAVLGSAAGAFYLGRHALRTTNYAEALRHFRAAAEKEYSPALLWLGFAYTRGYGVPVDLAKGLSYLERAADLGNFFARRELAILMIKGKLGMANFAVGLVLLPYYAVVALVDGLSNGYSERFLG
jgi:TPR repeat protein